ncbi:hypothetical protein [Agromyces archimandritae]|uniref:Uncharacterized protein n=1 Tax=Agromyces archimandritae TaxID=2781962 RepID=A0A975FK27_9MICO|nr:hypothetical protein [Agromyces archimandritae]QTX03372.1 hypothetical protein G127AT_08240 [Agromyces archimandritae]
MTRTRRILPAALAVLALGAALSGCADAEEKSAAERSDDELRTVAEEQWRTPVTPVGSSTPIVDGVAMAYATDDAGELLLIGVDVETGEEAWSWPASTADVGAGTVLYPRIVTADDREARVVVITPPSVKVNEDYGHRFRMIEPGTGSQIAISDPIWVTDPRSCETVSGICFEGRTDPEAEPVTMRLDSQTAEFAPSTSGV